MSNQITTAMIDAYKSGVQMLAQQKKSRLRNYVRVETIGAERASFDQIGATTAVQVTERHGDTPQMNTPHSRRWVTPFPYDWADLIDKPDMLRTLNEMTSPYQQNAAAAMGRAVDDAIIAAAFATALTGKTGSGSAAFDTANYQIAVAASGLTIAKLLSAKEMLDAAENDDPDDPATPRMIACSAKQISNMLNTTQVTSADYNSVKALANGQVDTYLGFKFIRIQRLGTDASGYRRVIGWCKNSLLLGVNQEMTVDIAPRKDKRNAMQVYVTQDIGATRMDETGVVEILCQE